MSSVAWEHDAPPRSHGARQMLAVVDSRARTIADFTESVARRRPPGRTTPGTPIHVPPAIDRTLVPDRPLFAARHDTTVGDNRVTIDLNGFELRRSLPVAGNTFGISVIGGDGNSIAISNGTITGFQYGVFSTGSGLRVERMGFSRNSYGISSNRGATVAHSTFTACGTGVAISSGTESGGNVVIDCVAKGSTVGFSGTGDSLFDRCSAHAITDRAFRLLSGATMRNCTANGVVGVHFTAVTVTRSGLAQRTAAGV